MRIGSRSASWVVQRYARRLFGAFFADSPGHTDLDSERRACAALGDAPMFGQCGAQVVKTTSYGFRATVISPTMSHPAWKCQSLRFDRSLSTNKVRLTLLQRGLTQPHTRLTDRRARSTNRSPRLTHPFCDHIYLKSLRFRVHCVNPTLVTRRLACTNFLNNFLRHPSDLAESSNDCVHSNERSVPGFGLGSALRNEGRATGRLRLSGPGAGAG